MKTRSITTLEQIKALPVGTVVVDPFDERGDAPVVACLAADGVWAALATGTNAVRAWFSDEAIIHCAKGRLLAVYVPGTEEA